eukprot:TRINITY_DN694_c0_g4_i1.p2 TRINITY_DN694_c0_g4~~TRINITY_DN694_c0_g4_i1.p2  ORF type:complete len:118 (+),score=1.41 TRINITY_DN694_c0_g4_i1:468-821(+)
MKWYAVLYKCFLVFSESCFEQSAVHVGSIRINEVKQQEFQVKFEILNQQLRQLKLEFRYQGVQLCGFYLSQIYVKFSFKYQSFFITPYQKKLQQQRQIANEIVGAKQQQIILNIELI